MRSHHRPPALPLLVTLLAMLAVLGAGTCRAEATVPVAVIDGAGSLSDMGGARIVSGPESADPRSHMRLVAGAVRIGGPGRPILGYSCPAGAGLDLDCALAALEQAPAAGARVVNMSFSVPQAAVPAGFRLRFAAAVAAARARGVVVVAAAAPGAPNLPADLPGVLAVGAADRQGTPIHPGDRADLHAPGHELEITDGTQRPHRASGSSFAAALVAGHAAALIAEEPHLGPDLVEARLRAQALAWPAGTQAPGHDRLLAGALALGLGTLAAGVLRLRRRP